MLLPLEGGLAAAGAAIRDGLLSAFLDDSRQASLRFYATGDDPQSAVSAYFDAMSEGAEWIIGPLRRESVQALLLVAATGGVLVYGTLDMPRFGDPQSPANTNPVTQAYVYSATPPQPGEPGGADDAALAPYAVGIPNTVTTVLASFRGYDTMGETAVIFTAGLGVLAILGGARRRRFAAAEGGQDDDDAAIDALVFRFEDASGAPLPSAAAADLFSALELWLDDGSEELEPGSDTLIESLETLLASAAPDVPVIAISAPKGQGIDAVLECIATPSIAGRRLLDIDYDIYAAGEAELGWVNLSAHLCNLTESIDLDQLAARLVGDVASNVITAGGEIAHVKVSILGGDCQAVANVVSNDSSVDVGLAANRSVSSDLQLVVNARVAIDPGQLESICKDSVSRISLSLKGKLNGMISHSLRPGRPQPTYRHR